MGRLSGFRGTRKIFLLSLIALSAMLATWAPVPTGPIGAATAWATSPDETLNPNNTPKATQAPTTTYDGSASSMATTTTTTSTLSWKDYVVLVWKYLAVSRF